MTHPLDGARAKVRRAGEHLKELNAEVQNFVKAHPYVYELKNDPDTGLPVYLVHAVGPDEQPPPQIGIIVGDIAHNLRSALDHVVCQLSLLQGGSCGGTQFPICDTKTAFSIDVDKKKRLGAAIAYRAAFSRVQPYNRRKSGILLACLRDLSNADKHRVVNPATQAMTWVAPVFDPDWAVLKATVRYQDRVRMEEGAEYLRFTELRMRAGTKVKISLSTTYNVIFGEEGKAEISAYSLGELRDHVRRLVARFAREF